VSAVSDNEQAEGTIMLIKWNNLKDRLHTWFLEQHKVVTGNEYIQE
jgi:hypothetical protein